MLTPEQITELVERLVGGHEEAMMAELFAQLTSSLATGGELTVRDERLLQSVAAMNREEVARIVAKYSRRIDAEVRDAVTQILIESDTGDTEILNSVYGSMVGAVGSSAAYHRIAQETAEGLARIIARNNLAMTLRAQQVWYEVTSEAIVSWNHGAESADRIITRAVRRLSREGFTTIDYASGVKSNLDVAVRRHIVTQVNQASGRMTMQRMAAYGHDLVHTSAHFGARPDHAVWQGRVFSLSGRTKGYPIFASSTGYGSVTGLQGANCRHTFGPYFEGITKLQKVPDKIAGMNGEQFYEATQYQRGLERAIRDTKREIAGLQFCGTDATSARLRLGNQQARLKAYIEAKQLPRQPLREKAYGITGPQPRALRRAS